MNIFSSIGKYLAFLMSQESTKTLINHSSLQICHNDTMVLFLSFLPTRKIQHKYHLLRWCRLFLSIAQVIRTEHSQTCVEDSSRPVDEIKGPALLIPTCLSCTFGSCPHAQQGLDKQKYFQNFSFILSLDLWSTYTFKEKTSYYSVNMGSWAVFGLWIWGKRGLESKSWSTLNSHDFSFFHYLGTLWVLRQTLSPAFALSP